MRLLDLFCGGGGAAMGYHRAGFEVVGVDNQRQPNYPFPFIRADAIEYLNGLWDDMQHGGRIQFDVIHAYVIENVPGAPINAQLMLCGTMFGLRIQKHRLFEANWSLPMAPTACSDHSECYNPWQGKGRSAEKLREAQGIDWLPMSGGASRKAGYTGDLFNAIPPAYTEYIGRFLAARLDVAA